MIETIPIDPGRLEYGTGDIEQSYSANLIMDGKFRRPLTWRGRSWVCVGGASGGKLGLGYRDAYRLTDARIFDGAAMAYYDKLIPDNGDRARADSLGFYHGMSVSSGKTTFVLTGPPVRFIPGEVEQPSLL